MITAAGVTAGIDMALHLVAREVGPEVAQAVQLGIEYDPDPPFDSGSPEKAPPEIVELVTDRSPAARRAPPTGRSDLQACERRPERPGGRAGVAVETAPAESRVRRSRDRPSQVEPDDLARPSVPIAGSGSGRRRDARSRASTVQRRPADVQLTRRLAALADARRPARDLEA